MKKVRIIQGTTVKGDVVNVGDILDLDDVDTRILISQKQAEPYTAPKEQPKPTEPPVDYEKMKIIELVDLAIARGVSVPADAKKGEIIELLKNALTGS